MVQEEPRRDLYLRSLALSQAAILAGCHETAYHTLAAALPCAESMGMADCLEQVAQVAREQLRVVNE
jgi:hypothetical protein